MPPTPLNVVIGPAAANGQPPPSFPVFDALDAVENRVASLADSVAQLASRLGPVRSQRPTVACGQGVSKGSAASPLAERLGRTEAAVNDIQVHLGVIWDELEI